MSFNSIFYLLFLFIVLLGYYLIPYKYRNIWLLLASYYFYMSWNATYSLLMLFVSLVAYLSAILLEHLNESRKCALAVGVTILACVLGVFKYGGFILENANILMRRIGLPDIGYSLDILLPVGISFYVIQSIGYLVDVYRKECPAEKNIINFMLFVSFFPQLVAGPIERAGNMLPQFRKKHVIQVDAINDGMRLILFGLFKKVAVADVCALYVNTVFDNLHLYKGFTLILASVLFAIQIYSDFSGYTDIARGSGRLLGFELRENFRAPYLATSPSEFWERWHTSLSQWMRDYIYIPLGGNRSGNVYVNTMLVFLISGLWHGAAWHFVYWGGVWGLLLCIERLCTKKNKKPRKNKKIMLPVMWVSIVGTWSLFRIQGLKELFYIVSHMWIDLNFDSFWNSLKGIEAAIWFPSATFGIWMFATLFLNIVILIWFDCKYNAQMMAGNIGEQFICHVSEWKKCFLYAWMLINVIVWFVIWKGSYVADADFIYFQF